MTKQEQKHAFREAFNFFTQHALKPEDTQNPDTIEAYLDSLNADTAKLFPVWKDNSLLFELISAVARYYLEQADNANIEYWKRSPMGFNAWIAEEQHPERGAGDGGGTAGERTPS